MSYQPPSLRARRTVIPVEMAQPLPAPELVALTRLALCEDCENYSNGQCRLFGCCDKTVSEKVKWALSQCPDNPPRWKRFRQLSGNAGQLETNQ